ncbi:proliferation marker protein Ki-67 [Corythoichthys intestinalis]|uniref:proliferation marker protein Ki-67 n=1 Tax=Corythoichthys intestinalis TaxID=161448 RepID=UPI0025A5D76D|nr:proliferation marker protein Ki-67 [Corythoichthys intestinalis]
MPLHGKIVVFKRSGGDGAEFPLVASHCLIGRKPDSDIRIQIPQVSKEHCRIDLNENKEVILTNLTSVNPTLLNGEVLQQPVRLKDGDVITIVDRSFRFEYPPAPTPKKFAKGRKSGTPNPHLKDGTNHNVERPLEQTKKDPKQDCETQQSKALSPFNDLYQMIRKSLDVKTPRKSTATDIQTPMRKSNASTVGTPKVADGKVVAEAKNKSNATPTSEKRRHSQIPTANVMIAGKGVEEVKSDAGSQTKPRVTPQKLSDSGAIEIICSPKPKSPMNRRSKELPAKEHAEMMASPQNTNVPGVTGNGVPKKRKSGDSFVSPASQMKKKRVSFGADLIPELFDKKLPPDSPLRKGENPRRSLCLSKPSKSLLRRASVIGLIKEAESPAKKNSESPKASVKKSPKGTSPGKNTPKPITPSPCKKLAKSTRASPEGQSPGKRSPKHNTMPVKALFSEEELTKSRFSYPASSEKTSSKLSLASPKSPKSTSVPTNWTPKPKHTKDSLSRLKSPKSRSSSPSQKLESPLSKSLTCDEMPTSTKRASPRFTPQGNVNETPAKTPQGSRMSISSVQGRFSVSHIETPSPIAEKSTVTVTPKIPLKRKSMKSASRKTPLAKSTIKNVVRRSGISRASMKALNSWADTVRFGKAKIQAPVPAKKAVRSTVTNTKVAKKVVPRPQTPVRKPLNQVSTGHADSPVTIVVGRAFKQKIANPTNAAPKVIFNTAISKKNMKMDEDLSGISEMFKTPLKEDKKKMETNNSDVTKTPLAVNEPSVLEPSVLNTPEETGEMVVSPLTLASTGKASNYNKDAVKRLLNISPDSSSDTSAFEMKTTSVSQTCIELVSAVPTLKQKTPRPKTEIVDDLRETLSETPKQKPEQQECFTGVKRMMRTPRQKSEPVEDLRGKLLKTPKQKPEQKECLTGVKRMMKTPRQKNEPVEDLRGKLLKTPKQKPEQKECLTGVKRIMKTPREKTEPLEDLRGKLLKTPKQKLEPNECLTGIKRIFTTPKQCEPNDIQGELLKTPRSPEDDVSCTAHVPLLEKPVTDLPTAAKEYQEHNNLPTPKVNSSPVDSGIKRIFKTPKQRSAPIEGILGIARLMKTPKEKSKPVEDNFCIQQLMTSPRLRHSAPLEAFEGLNELLDDQPKHQDQAVSSDLDEVKESTEVSEECECTEEAVSQAVFEDAPQGADMDEAPAETANTKKSVRGRKAKTAEPKIVTAESPLGPVRERRGKKAEPSEPLIEETNASSKPKRGRYVKKVEMVQEAATEISPKPEIEQYISVKVESTTDSSRTPLEKEAAKPKRGRYAKRALEQIDTVPKATDETSLKPEHETSLPVNIEPPVNDSAAPLEKEAVKPKRGRYAKKAIEQLDAVPETVAQTLQKAESETCLHVGIEKESVKPRRGRYAKRALEQIDTVSKATDETSLKPEKETSLPVNIEPAVTSSVAPLEIEAVKPRRGRYAKKALEQLDAVNKVATETLSNPESETNLPVDIEPAINSSVTPLEKEAVKPKRGRYAKRALQQIDTVPKATHETLLKPEHEMSLPVNIEPAVNDNVAPLEKEAMKPKRGRYAKKPLGQLDAVPETVSQTLENAKSDTSISVDIEPAIKSSVTPLGKVAVKPKRGRYAKKALEQIDTVHEVSSETLLKPERETSLFIDIEPAINISVAPLENEAIKPKRGRRAKKATEQIDAVSEALPETLPNPGSEASLPVNIKPGMNESVALCTVEKPKRGRYAKKAVEQTETTLEPTTETLQGSVSEPEVTHSVEHLVEEAVKPKRGRKPKRQSAQSKLTPPPACSDDVSKDEPAQDDHQGQSPSEHHDNASSESTESSHEVETAAAMNVPVVDKKAIRGKRGKPAESTADEDKPVEDFEDAGVAAPVRARRGKIIQTTAPPAGRKAAGRRNTKRNDDISDALPEMITEKDVVSEQPKVSEPDQMSDQASGISKSRRGVRKPKQDAAASESTENLDGPIETPTEKPKPGSRAKQHKADTVSETSGGNPEPEQKRQRGRAALTSLKTEIKHVVTVKRTRRGAAAACEEAQETVPTPVPESELPSVEPVKRGRRAVAKPSTELSAMNENHSITTKDSNNASAPEAQKSVKWNLDVKVHTIQKSVKVVRGKRSSPIDRMELQSRSESENADKTEEDLSGKEMESPPPKRARRGAKLANDAESASKEDSKNAEDTQMQPNTRRRARAVKK